MNTPTPVKKLVSIPDAATMLSISRRTVWKMIACGDLPKPLRVRGSRRLKVSDIDEYIDKLSEGR